MESRRAADCLSRNSQNRAIQVGVLAASELGVEARADLDQRGDTALDLHRPFRRTVDAADDLQQRAFSGAISSDDAKPAALGEIEVDIFQAPELGLGRRLTLVPARRLEPAHGRFFEPARVSVVLSKTHRNILQDDVGVWILERGLVCHLLHPEDQILV